MWETISYLGLSPPEMFAGFAGGVVNVFWLRRTKPVAIFGAIISGALTANYFGVIIGNYLGTVSGHAGAFVVGAFGPGVVILYLRKWKPDFFTEGRSNGNLKI